MVMEMKSVDKAFLLIQWISCTLQNAGYTFYMYHDENLGGGDDTIEYQWLKKNLQI